MDENGERGTRDRQESNYRSSSAEPEQSIPPDRVLSAVANDHRRAVLESLDNVSEKTLSYDALVDRVAERVRDEREEGVSDEHRQCVRIALYHTHLPKLEDARIIDYEAETGHIQFVGGELVRDLQTLVNSYDTDE